MEFDEIRTENYYRISNKDNSTREARLICDESFSVSSKVWNVKFLRDNKLRFVEGMYYEDELFSIKTNIIAATVYLIKTFYFLVLNNIYILNFNKKLEFFYHDIKLILIFYMLKFVFLLSFYFS